MPSSGVVQMSAVERKLQSKANGVSVKRAKSFNSTSAPTSPSALRRNKQPALEPRYNKSTHLLIEAKRLAKEIEEQKKKGNPLLRPSSAKTINFGSSSRSRTGSGGSSNGISIGGTKVKRPSTGDPIFRISSPVLTSKFNRRRAKSQYAREPRQSSETDGSQPGPSLFDGRLTPLRGSGRKRNYVSPTGKSCDECERTLKSGYYSEHRGLPYCNVPCYTSLFSSLLNRDDVDDSCTSLSDEQKQLRASLIPKLRTYNTYYAGKPCQISCREINDRFVLEGVIKVYWGLRSPVTLADSEVSHYWQHFQPDDGGRRESTENIAPNMVFDDRGWKKSFGRRVKNPAHVNGTNDGKYKYKRKESGGSSEGSRKRIGCSVCSSEFLGGENTTFIPPYGTPTTLRLTNHVAVPVVIDMLLKKFQIKDSRKRFTLFTVYESGGQRKLLKDSYPLLTRLSLGPCEDVAKIFIMDAADGTEIPLEVAQYIKFNTAVLQTFVQKFHEEEEREVERIKEKYREYKDLLMKRIHEFEHNNNFLKKEE